MEKKTFPQYLSLPFQVLWFETDELIIALIFYVMALVFGNVLWLMIGIGPYAYSSIKRKYPRGFFKHSLYFIGLISIKGYPNFFESEFSE